VNVLRIVPTSRVVIHQRKQYQNSLHSFDDLRPHFPTRCGFGWSIANLLSDIDYASTMIGRLNDAGSLGHTPSRIRWLPMTWTMISSACR